MSAEALRAGPLAAAALAEGQSGRVAAAYRHAVSVLLDGGALVALLPEWAPLHPWAVTVASGPDDFGKAAEGDAVRVAGGVLEAGGLSVRLGGMETADLRLRARLRGVDRAALDTLARLVPAPAGGGPIESALSAALESFRATGDAAVLAVLTGMGEGLTPSGDDVIVGALAAFDACRAAAPRAREMRERLCAALKGSGVRTTRLASQLIEAAVDGFYAEPILGLLHALAEGAEAPALEGAVTGLLAVGHRSGADTLRGIVAALGSVAPG